MHAGRHVGDVAAVSLGESELLELRPDIRLQQLISQRHPGDVNQVGVVGGADWRSASSGLMFERSGCLPSTSAAARRTNGSGSLNRAFASSENAAEISARSASAFRL